MGGGIVLIQPNSSGYADFSPISIPIWLTFIFSIQSQISQDFLGLQLNSSSMQNLPQVW